MVEQCIRNTWVAGSNPVISSILTDNIIKTIEFVKEMKLNEIHILPYHTLGLEKYRQLKMTYMGNDYKKHTPEDLEKVREMVEAGGLKCKING